MRVRIAIDLALDRLFTYEVPEALQEKLAVGQLLSVPFGHRAVQGFAIEVGDWEEPEGIVLKSVVSIVDETPFFSPQLLTLVTRIARYTCSPIESVLRSALPAVVLKRDMRPREQLYVDAVAELPEGTELTVRQRWLHDQLVRLDGGWIQQVCEELKTTPATLRELARKGAATVEPRQRRRDPLGNRRVLPTKPLPLNAEQTVAVAAIGDDSDARPVLLYGITGSGKTEVYLQAIAHELETGRGAIVMVPEIALTPQTVQRFASRFGPRVAVLHSALSDGERYDEWHRIRSGEARVVVGPRSAVFAPVRNLGLIVVDEEHETSYKQDETPRYHARDVAVLRGAVENARVVLGSATPSLESWMNARNGKYRLVTMLKRAGAGTLPRVELIDLSQTAVREAERAHAADESAYRGMIYSPELLEAIRLRLDRGEQTILFLNRRGYSRSVMCTDCGAAIECPGCSLPYTYHRADRCLRCHICGGWCSLPAKCPACGSLALTYRGVGTQRAEAALAKCFPRAVILRMDADSTSRRHSHDDLLGMFRRGEAQILLGTQMIAKGLDFPNVTLVGVLNADSSLMMPDFRAGERTFQLLAQVSGRAGRAELPGEVFIQSRDPSVGTIRFAAQGDYRLFAEAELAERRSAYYPPYCHLATLNLRSQDRDLVADWADMYAKSLAKYAARLSCGRIEIGEAVPSAIEKADGWYRWQVVVRAPSARVITEAWKWLREVRPAPRELVVVLDVDAYNLV